MTRFSTTFLCSVAWASISFGSPLQGLQFDAIKPHPREAELYKRDGGPVKAFFAMMGDSFGSGIGAGKAYIHGEKDRCKRGDLSTGSGLQTSDEWWEGEQGNMEFIACSGTKTYHMHKDAPKFKDKDPQDKEFAILPNDAAVLWAGGNDAFFFNLLDGCVYYFYGPRSIGCEDAFRDSILEMRKDSFKENFKTVYREILDAAHPQAEKFTLYLLGYPKFWNAGTDECDHSRFVFWKLYPPPEVTKEVRGDMNALTEELNSRMVVWAAEVLDEFKDSKPNVHIRYIDTDPAFEGHRFCEPGSVEPNPLNKNNYFFQLDDQDTSPKDGENYDNLPDWPKANVKQEPPAFEDCERDLGNGNNASTLDFGEEVACRIVTVVHHEEGNTDNDLENPELFGSDYSGVEYARIFHPKAIGHDRVKNLILQTIDNDGGQLPDDPQIASVTKQFLPPTSNTADIPPTGVPTSLPTTAPQFTFDPSTQGTESVNLPTETAVPTTFPPTTSQVSPQTSAPSA